MIDKGQQDSLPSSEGVPVDISGYMFPCKHGKPYLMTLGGHEGFWIPIFAKKETLDDWMNNTDGEIRDYTIIVIHCGGCFLQAMADAGRDSGLRVRVCMDLRCEGEKVRFKWVTTTAHHEQVHS